MLLNAVHDLEFFRVAKTFFNGVLNERRMKLALFGGTGRTGLWVIKEGLDRGHEISALVRSPEKIDVESPRLHLLTGSPLQIDDVRATITGTEAVACCLNINRKNDTPWAKVTTPENLISECIKNCIDVMHEEGIARIITISAFGVGDTKAALGVFGRMFLYGTNIKYAYLDHERQERLLSASDLDWTILRPTFLGRKNDTGTVIASINGQPKPRGSVARRNVARFILDCAEKGIHVKEYVTLSEK
jgi:uncharacterized protein YbjT (DUF2867 family)